MVKFGKNKLKALNRVTKQKNKLNDSSLNNKVLKKKINAEKKLTFHKEVMTGAVRNEDLVKNVTARDIHREELSKKYPKPQQQTSKPKIKHVKKQKKRQKTQISDTKLLLGLMNKKTK